MKTFSVIILSCLLINIAQADDERFWADAKINGKPIRLVVDTGAAPPMVLYSKSANRLGIKFTQIDVQPIPGHAPFGWSEPYNIELDDSSLGVIDGKMSFRGKISIPVVEMASNEDLPGDGAIGWHAIRSKVFSIDAIAHKISVDAKGLFLKGDQWETFQLETNLDILGIDAPLGKGTKGVIVFDTGSPYGVSLAPQYWSEWKTGHTNQPSTFVNYYTLGFGENVTKEFWSDKLTLGSLTLTDVAVMEADSNDRALNLPSQTQYVASLGVAALKRLDIVIDGKNGYAFVRPKTTSSLPYQHNRLGADFRQRASYSNYQVAHVVNGSPAYDAGICDGDILLDVSKWDSMEWHADTNLLSKIYEYPAGTKLELTLKRGENIFKTTAILQNILPPDASKN